VAVPGVAQAAPVSPDRSVVVATGVMVGSISIAIPPTTFVTAAVVVAAVVAAAAVATTVAAPVAVPAVTISTGQARVVVAVRPTSSRRR
jgi:hypothetical protein